MERLEGRRDDVFGLTIPCCVTQTLKAGEISHIKPSNAILIIVHITRSRGMKFGNSRGLRCHYH